MDKIKDKIIAVITIVWTVLAGMIGGQTQKGVRRFGIPGFAVIASCFTGEFEWRDFVLILLLPILLMGYGEKSLLMAWLHYDWLVRLVYAALLSIPFYFYHIRRGLIASFCLLIAFSLRAGSLGRIAWLGDVLLEDIFRYGALGVLISWQIIFPRQQNNKIQDQS